VNNDFARILVSDYTLWLGILSRLFFELGVNLGVDFTRRLFPR
jgi:hypothetical protein